MRRGNFLCFSYNKCCMFLKGLSFSHEESSEVLVQNFSVVLRGVILWSVALEPIISTARSAGVTREISAQPPMQPLTESERLWIRV